MQSQKSVTRIVKGLALDIVNSCPERVINLNLILRETLLGEGFSRLHSDELAELWNEQLIREVGKVLSDWDDIGVPRPCIPYGNSQDTLITYRHEKYISKLPYERLSGDFGDTLHIVDNLNPKQLLITSSLLLQITNCRPIFITDVAGDSGVDCIGLLVSGPLRSTCLFVQAKSSKNTISKDVVQLEYQKFSDMKQDAQFTRYLAALGKGISADGVSVCYIITTNSEFEKPAIEFAQKKQILLRSRRQIAYWIAHYFGTINYQNALDDMANQAKPNLALDLTSIIESYRRA